MLSETCLSNFRLCSTSWLHDKTYHVHRCRNSASRVCCCTCQESRDSCQELHILYPESEYSSTQRKEKTRKTFLFRSRRLTGSDPGYTFCCRGSAFFLFTCFSPSLWESLCKGECYLSVTSNFPFLRSS